MLATEQQNAHTLEIDTLGTLDILRVINDEDQKVALAVQRALPQIAEVVEAAVQALQNGGHLLYVGAGASGRTGVIDAVECVPTYSAPAEWVQGVLAGGERAMMQSVEGAEDDTQQAARDLEARCVSGRDLVIGIAASGTTPYVLGALAYARSAGARTVGISCNAPAPLLDAADIAVPLVVGPEVITGSTRMKAGTAQKMALNMISTATMVRLGKVYGNLMVDVQTTNLKLVDRAIRIIMHIADVDRPTAETLLRTCDGSVKRAIVAHRRGVTPAEADRLLHEAGGHLRKVID